MDFLDFDPLSIREYHDLTIGRGTIGGKAKGLVFACEVLKRKNEWRDKIFVPESMFIGTQVMERFVEYNKLAPVIRMRDYPRIEKAFIEATFPGDIEEKLIAFLKDVDYPLAIRSSSLLEDSLRYSFAGKYLTVFIPNRGSLRERVKQLEDAIKKVYASTHNPNAYEYRRKHNLRGERMAIIVQRLIGHERGRYFYPTIAGVGFSKNYRRWTTQIKIDDGVVRVVFGLGTRCTGRNYARIFSLTIPELRPEGNNPRDISKYSQETFDALDMETGELASFNINYKKELIQYHPYFNKLALLYEDNELKPIPVLFNKVKMGSRLIFDFQLLLNPEFSFFPIISFLFKAMEEAMGIPVDIEFTYEPSEDRLALVQVRPLSSYEDYQKVEIPSNIDEADILFRSNGMLTNGKREGVNYILYVDHDAYRQSGDFYRVARAVGRLNKVLEGKGYILVGPGRWGSNNPRLGVPVRYGEISNASVMVELGIPEEDFVPELSYGTHFFADLELDGILYMPVFIHKEGNLFNAEWFNNTPYEKTSDPAVRLYKGKFSAYLDGDSLRGVILKED